METTGGFPSQMAGNMENVFHAMTSSCKHTYWRGNMDCAGLNPAK